jgi:hypothetical protein
VDRNGSKLSAFTSTDGGKTWQQLSLNNDLGEEGYTTLKDPIVVGIAQETHKDSCCGGNSGTAVVSNFQAGDLSLAGLLPGDANSGADGNLILKDASGAPGGTATVEISVDDKVTSLAGFNLTLQFNPLLSISDADIAAGPLLISPAMQVNTTSPGRVSVAIASNQASKGPGLLARLSFHLPPDAKLGTTYPISVVKLEGNDTGKSLSLGYKGGNIKVDFRLPGDVNGDGKVNTLDATLTLRFVVGTATPTPDQKAGADINGDGAINVQDATLILRKAVGL